MKLKRSHATRLASVGCLVITTVTASAEQADGFVVVPSVGYHMFSNETSLGNDYNGSLGLGYKFEGAWGFEMTYQRGGAEPEISATETTIEQVRLDALYHFARDGQVQPFLLLGGGNERWEYRSTAMENSILNAGAGLKIWLGDRASVRTDMRIINDIDNERTSYAVGLGINFLFGGSRPAATMP